MNDWMDEEAASISPCCGNYYDSVNGKTVCRSCGEEYKSKPKGATDDTVITIPVGFHKAKLNEAMNGGFYIGSVFGTMLGAFVLGMGILMYNAFISGTPMPQEVVFTGVLEKAYEFFVYPGEVQLHFAGKQEFSAETNKVPYYVGLYQELVCEKDAKGRLKMVRNYCPSVTDQKKE